VSSKKRANLDDFCRIMGKMALQTGGENMYVYNQAAPPTLEQAGFFAILASP
jgi:hypothetical protein